MNIDHKTAFNEFLNSQLNSEQSKAVKHTDNALLVIAGAGSGKTRVITARIAHLILNCGVSPRNIIALTFTNKAAKEMQERILHFLGNDHELPFIGTFHSYCLRVLKKNQELLETPFFSILDDDDQQKLLTGIIQRSGLHKEITAKNLSYQISHIKNHATNTEEIAMLYSVNPRLEALYKAYEQEKRASKALDFDDLLLEVLSLFKRHPGFKIKSQEMVRHILVDEYQDTNVVQHELLKQMAHDTKKECVVDSICVVGDEDQSIYSWRGATIANIINFKQDFPLALSIKIEQNYRSVQPILDVANSVISNNKQRNPKHLWSDKKAVDRIRHVVCLSEYQEGDIIAQLAHVASKTEKLSSIAVLYRTHFQSRAIEEALIRNSIPYKIIGGVQFYERKEIKDLLAYLRLVVNPFDRAAFFRVINVPARGLGAAFEELFYNHWHDEAFLSFIDIGKKLIETMQVTGTKKNSLNEFLNIFKGLKSTDKPTNAVDHIISELNYLAYLKENFDPEDAQTRIDNIKELMNALKHFETNNINSIEQFLDEVALMQEKMNKKDANHDAILLMTLHAAKGLEFNTVILAGLEEGLLPSSRSMMQEASLEEERRLFYVGITRARERLLITQSRYRYAYRNMTDQLPSRFLNELPKQLAQREDASYWKTPEIRTYFSKWFSGNVQTAPSPVMTFGAAQHKVVKQEPVITTATVSAHPKSPFKLRQPVQHATFGIGLVELIEIKNATSIYITVNFKGGKKKVAAEFLKTV
ncbi:MAG: UvrD-helicase domain-containing protein [Candidatus Dependentiae bacterium]|nr:UvrD-helicase domain-containing protein [Candidatus Dependentiae bacterium]